ncbi:MAG: TIM barrel protein [bacterium]|nr:TIM barrel protein [bacterium]
MANSGIRPYSVHLRHFDLSVNDSETVNRCVALCNNIHSIFKPKIAIIHPGKGEVETLVSNLHFILQKLPRDMTIALENMTSPDAPINSPETLRRFIEIYGDLPSNLGICIDTSHYPFGIWSQIDPDSYTSFLLDYMEAAAPRLSHLHFSDVAFENGNYPKHLPIGEGIIDWQRIDGHLLKSRYGGKATIEIRFTDNLVKKTIASASRYYGLEETLLRVEGGSDIMPKLDKIERNEFLAKLAELPSLSPMPSPLSSIIALPNEGLLEKTEDSIYFVVPSPDYEAGHADPYDAITGDADDNLKWADYLFGVRYHGTYLSAVLIDKERKISVAETILGAHSIREVNWGKFEEAVKTALKYAKGKNLPPSLKLDHINFTSVGDLEFIESVDPRAWR